MWRGRALHAKAPGGQSRGAEHSGPGRSEGDEPISQNGAWLCERGQEEGQKGPVGVPGAALP